MHFRIQLAIPLPSTDLMQIIRKQSLNVETVLVPRKSCSCCESNPLTKRGAQNFARCEALLLSIFLTSAPSYMAPEGSNNSRISMANPSHRLSPPPSAILAHNNLMSTLRSHSNALTLNTGHWRLRARPTGCYNASTEACRKP